MGILYWNISHSVGQPYTVSLYVAARYQPNLNVNNNNNNNNDNKLCGRPPGKNVARGQERDKKAIAYETAQLIELLKFVQYIGRCDTLDDATNKCSENIRMSETQVKRCKLNDVSNV